MAVRSRVLSAVLLAAAARAVVGLRRRSDKNKDEAGTGKEGAGRSPAWALETIGASSRTSGGRGVSIYVMSSGILYTHSEFGGRAIPAYDTTKWLDGRKECSATSSTCGVDKNGRGTQVASAAAGATYGAAPQATLHSVKVMKDDGSIDESRFLKGLDFVVSKAILPAVVVMTSQVEWDGRGDQARFNALMDTATSKGIVAVAGAGNIERDSCNFWPSMSPLAITVGGMEEFMGYFRKTSNSNYGACVDLYAPSSAVWGASMDGDSSYDYQRSSTGVAAGLVAGAAAAALEKNPSMSPAKVLQGLQATALKDLIEIQDHLVSPGDKNLLLHF